MTAPISDGLAEFAAAAPARLVRPSAYPTAQLPPLLARDHQISGQALGLIDRIGMLRYREVGMRWEEFEAQQPALASIGIRRLMAPGVVLVATIRRDGSPRVSPDEPLLWEGELWLSMGLGSLKAADLRRDARILVHSIVTSRNGQAGENAATGMCFTPVTGSETLRNRVHLDLTGGAQDRGQETGRLLALGHAVSASARPSAGRRGPALAAA